MHSVNFRNQIIDTKNFSSNRKILFFLFNYNKCASRSLCIVLILSPFEEKILSHKICIIILLS